MKIVMTLLLLAYKTMVYIRYNSPGSEMSVVGRKKRFRETSHRKEREKPHFSHGTKLGGIEAKFYTHVEILC